MREQEKRLCLTIFLDGVAAYNSLIYEVHSMIKILYSTKVSF